jgi:hypothetical protein
MFCGIDSSQTSGLQGSAERTKVIVDNGRGQHGTHLLLTEGVLTEAARKVPQDFDNLAACVFSAPQSLSFLTH